MQSKEQAVYAYLDNDLGQDWQATADAEFEQLGFTTAELIQACLMANRCDFIGRTLSLITSTAYDAHVSIRVTDSFVVTTDGIRLEAARSASMGGHTHHTFGALPLACKLIEALIGRTSFTKAVLSI